MLHLTCGVRRQSTFGGQLSPARSGRDVSRRLSLSVEHPSVGPVERPHVPVALELLWLERDVAVRGALGFVPVDDAVVAHLSERVVHDPTGRVVALAVAQQARVGAVVLLQQLCPLLGLGGVSSGACLGDHRLGGRAHLGANALDFGQQLRVADVESCLLDDVLGRPHAEVGQAQWVVDVEPAAELSGAEHAGRGLIAEMESELSGLELIELRAGAVINLERAAFAVAHGTVAEPALEVLVSHLWRQLGLPFLGSSQHLLTSGVFCFPRPRDGGALGLGRLLQRAKVRRRVEHRLLPSLPLQVRRELGFVERAVGGDGQLAADEPTQGVLDLVAREPVGHGLPERRVAPAALRHEPAQVRDVELLGRKRHRTRLQVVEVLCLLGGFTGLVVALRCTSGCVLGGILGLLPLPHRVRWQIEASVEDAWIAGVEGAAVEDRLDGGRVHDLQFTLTVAEPAHAGANDRVVAAFARQDVDGLALVSVINPGVAELAAVGVLFDHLANPLLDLRVVHIENLLSADVEGLRLPEARGILLARREVVAITEIATSVAVRVQLLASLICLLGAGPKHGIVRVHL